MPKPMARKQNDNKKSKKHKPEKKVWSAEETEDVLALDVEKLLRDHAKIKDQPQTADQAEVAKPTLPEPFTEIDVAITDISSTGDGLALSENGDHVYVVPFTVPGDKARVKVVRHVPQRNYSVTDFLKVLEPGPQRDDSRIKCPYFSQCSGCQLQMMSYEDQLKHKKRVVEKAYANFSGLIPELVPSIEDTFPSPRQYGYRTKLTPHFPNPMKGEDGERKIPPFGFNMKNRRAVLDIEDCPLGTDILRRGLQRERRRVVENLQNYKRGATVLLRESTTRVAKSDVKDSKDDEDVIRTEYPNYIEEKRCVTDHNGVTVEYVDDFVFRNKAGAFFQNNNSILSGFTDYIRQRCHAPESGNEKKPIKYLLDAYSGSGLFTVTLSNVFESSLGIDIAPESIAAARENAAANNLPRSAAQFAAADAATLFKDVPFPADETLLVIDPPRKGCSQDFLRQLLAYGPRRVVYVSCNVHTQARDVGVLVQGRDGVRYEIESIRGFDFFPQTGHVEGVAVLNKVVDGK
ncbi:hypothetical protein VTN49DRAFT_7750 [Thermomyces lanuginosus]|uniref:uncharacterized protein n=1 Tax=Thermomyces lanuginosus TaxID=5541 RepID=UPI00374302AE